MSDVTDSTLPEGVKRVRAALIAAGHPHAPVMLDDAARTAQQAADALGIGVGQIAKSIIFRRKEDDVAVLVVTSGDRRVDEKRVARWSARSAGPMPNSSRRAPVFPSGACRRWRTCRRRWC